MRSSKVRLNEGEESTIGNRFFFEENWSPSLHVLRCRTFRKRAVICGSGPSVHDRKVAHRVRVVLNGSWRFVTDDPPALTIGVMLDSQKGPIVYGREDPCDFYVMPDHAWVEERTPESKSIVWTGPLPIHSLCAQSFAAWFMRLLGARELHFYGCDSVFGDCTNLYEDPQLAPHPEQPQYAVQGPHAAYLAGDVPTVWHRGDEELTEPPGPLKPLWVTRAWRETRYWP